MRRTWWVVVLGLAACKGDDSKDGSTVDAIPSDGGDADADADADSDADADADADADTDADTDPTVIDTADSGTTTQGCGFTVVDQFPVDGATDVYFQTDVWFVLSDVDYTATVSIEDVYGNAVTGATTVDGALVQWEGDPLLPLTEYVSTLQWCGGSLVSHFTTSDVGDPLGLDPTGLVYSIQLSTGVWAKPPLLGPALQTLIGNAGLLVTPTAVNVDTIDMLGAYGYLDVQDLCAPTLSYAGLVWDDPNFDLASPTMSMDVSGLLIEVTDVTVVGSFAADGSRIQFGTLEGLIDTRNLGVPLGLGSAYDSVCIIAATLGATCEACPDGQPYCLALAVSDLEAPQVPGTLVPRTLTDIANDPSCP